MNNKKIISDPVTLTVIDNKLVNICKEMGTAMMTTAFSPIFSESGDLSCAIFNKHGMMIGQAEFCPAQLGAIIFTMEWAIKELGIETFEQGDIVIHNDPFRGGCHIPEHSIIKPVFYDNKLFGFVANIAHIAEVGGSAPGGFVGDATEVFQEGLRLPPIKIVKNGKDVDDVWKIILSNHRTPKATWADFKAMIGSLHLAERRLIEMLDEYGVDVTEQALNDLEILSEKRMRAEILEIPDGEYSYEDFMEDDGISDKSYKIKALVIVKGDELLVDYTGTDLQAKGPINATYGVTASATYNAVFNITDPNIPRNLGCYRPISIIAPPGTLVNVSYPGSSVGGNTETHPRIVEILFGALSKAVPSKIAASDGGTCANFVFGGIHPENGETFVQYHFEGVGWGGRYQLDGNDALIIPNGGTTSKNTPIEIFDVRYPLRTDSYSLVKDSGGPGKFRGGLGTSREWTVTADEITVSALFDRAKLKPFGLFGGQGGGLSGLYIKISGKGDWLTFSEVFKTISPSKFSNIRVKKGDKIRLVTSGGGGYGSPLERDPSKIIEDVSEGYVSLQAAKNDYHKNIQLIDNKFKIVN